MKALSAAADRRRIAYHGAMTARPDAAWLAHELDRWAARVSATARSGAESWTLSGPGPNALVVEVTIADERIEVAFGEWRQQFALDDDDAPFEAAELVAAGLFGHARVELHRISDEWVRFDVQFRCDDRWRSFATLTRTKLAFWRRPAVVYLVNAVAPPPELRLGECGRLPTAPWLGLLADDAEPAARELPLDGEIDLHPFAPKEVASVVREYIDACRERGVFELRIVHGKGIGHLRRTVHALLADHPAVASYRLGGHAEGSWGATMVTLKRP